MEIPNPLKTQEEIIYDKLLLENYAINDVVVHFDKNFAQFTIEFEKISDLNNFLQKMHNMNIYSSSNYNDSEMITMSVKYKNNLIESFENLRFPQNTKQIRLFVDGNRHININTMLRLNNLPSNLDSLIIASFFQINLDNLPSSIKTLNLKDSFFKFNLDYLPESIEKLHLPSYGIAYELDEIQNFPKSIKKIYYKDIYYSLNEFIEYNSYKKGLLK